MKVHTTAGMERNEMTVDKFPTKLQATAVRERQEYMTSDKTSKTKTVFCLARKVFIRHLIPVVLVACLIALSGSGEAELAWALFLLLDFPLSIIVMITSGPMVVGVPVVFQDYGWFFCSVIWPATVFQVIGTINWIALLYLCGYR